MTIEQLKRPINEKPFRAFVINLADGRRLRVRSPEFVSVPPRAERTFLVWGDAKHDYTIVDLLLVQAIDVRNGRPARRGRG